MKKLISQIAVILIIADSGLTNAQWFEQNNPIPNSTIRDIYVKNETNAIAVGKQFSNGGIILQTTDGINWTSIPIESTYSINSVDFVNDSVGWIVGAGSQEKAIQKTTDGGLSWTGQYGGYENSVHTIYFIDEDTGWAAGSYDGGVYFRYTLKTTDGGTNWIYPNLTGIVDLFFFIDQFTGWAISNSNIWGGGPATILKTTDAGYNWLLQSEVDHHVNSIQFIDQYTGWITSNYWDGSSDQGIVFNTNNGGETWKSHLIDTTNYLNDICFIDAHTGWVVGNGGVIWKTSDGGNNWFSQESGTNHNLNAIQFFNENIGWAIGDSGTILKTTNGGVTFLAEENNLTQPDDFVLEQNYPNPFNPNTNISYILSAESQVKLSIYNPLGELVETIVNEKQSAGKYDAVWNAANHPSGVYIYILNAVSLKGNEQNKLSKKMILLK